MFQLSKIVLIFTSSILLFLQNVSIASLSDNISVTIAANLSYIEAVDANNSNRKSSTVLQMVSNDVRDAIITAHKDNPI